MKATYMVILIGISTLVVAYFGFCLYVAGQIIKPGTRKISIQPTAISPNYQEVSFLATDGLKLSGWFFPAKSKKVVIMVSGLNNTRVNEDYGTQFIAQDLISQGYNVLLYDTRTNGLSEGKKVTFGLSEQNDVVGAVAYIKSKGFADKEIAIIADSMGTTSTLLGISRLKGIGAIVLDSSPEDFKTVLSDGLQREHHVPAFTLPTIYFFMKTFFGVDINQDKPIATITKDPNRVYLFLHCDQDQVVPIQNSRDLLAKANSNSQLVVFHNCGHVETYKTNPVFYKQQVFSFLASQLK